MERPAAALQLLRSQDWTHLPVDVEESDPIGGQLQQGFKVFLQVTHCLLQTEADGLHPLAPANIHHGAAGAQVHLSQWGQVTIFGYEDVVPGRKQGSCQITEGFCCFFLLLFVGKTNEQNWCEEYYVKSNYTLKFC